MLPRIIDSGSPTNNSHINSVSNTSQHASQSNNINNGVNILHQKGDECFRKHNYLQAIEYFTAALRFTPHNSILLVKKSRALLRCSPARVLESVSCAEEAVTLDVTSPDAHEQLGWAKLSNNDNAGALAAFETAQMLGGPSNSVDNGLAFARSQPSGMANGQSIQQANLATTDQGHQTTGQFNAPQHSEPQQHQQTAPQQESGAAQRNSNTPTKTGDSPAQPSSSSSSSSAQTSPTVQPETSSASTVRSSMPATRALSQTPDSQTRSVNSSNVQRNTSPHATQTTPRQATAPSPQNSSSNPPATQTTPRQATAQSPQNSPSNPPATQTTPRQATAQSSRNSPSSSTNREMTQPQQSQMASLTYTPTTRPLRSSGRTNSEATSAQIPAQSTSSSVSPTFDSNDQSSSQLTESLADIFNASTNPPDYAPNSLSTDPVVRQLSRATQLNQIQTLGDALAITNRGTASLRVYLDLNLRTETPRVVYAGLQPGDLGPREKGEWGQGSGHAIFQDMFVNLEVHPNSTLMDMDKEVSSIVQGKTPGTSAMIGYSELYRDFQLGYRTVDVVASPDPTADPLPRIGLNRLVEIQREIKREIQSFAVRSLYRKIEIIRELLGPSRVSSRATPTTLPAASQVKLLCLALNRRESGRFVDLSTSPTVTNYTTGVTFTLGLDVFMYQLTLGFELFSHLYFNTYPLTPGLITHSTSMLLVLVESWLRSIELPPGPGPLGYNINSLVWQTQTDGLMRFAELIRWPYTTEAREYAEGAFGEIILGRVVSKDMSDWLFGMVRPGVKFRALIMSCLIASCDSTKSLGRQPSPECGIVLPTKAYWPERTVLGSILGGLRNATSNCGWVGPTPRPPGDFPSGWVRIEARMLALPRPCVAESVDGNFFERYLFDSSDTDGSTAENRMMFITNPSNWIAMSLLPREMPTLSTVQFTRLHLQRLSGTVTSQNSYRASLQFSIGAREVTFTAYTAPAFVCVHPCMGTHVMFNRKVEDIQRNQTVKALDLADTYVRSTLLVIDARARGEELFARAWCAEKGKNAVIRRGGGCCLTCAITQTTSSNGIGFNVLIVSSDE